MRTEALEISQDCHSDPVSNFKIYSNITYAFAFKVKVIHDFLFSYNLANPNVDYSFHHIQNFTKDVSEFRGKIDGSKVAGGQDLPESGMDAIMQTIVCQGLLLKVFR